MNENEPGGYLFDAEDSVEMTRLLQLGTTVTDAIGSYFPLVKEEQKALVRDVLDIGCGPGEWAIGVARKYSQMTVTGIDISKLMMDFANLEAQSRGASACFRVMDATKPLEFPDASFDLVHFRFIVGFMRRNKWPDLFKECARILRPGGYLLLTEGDQYAMISPSLIAIYGLMTKLLWQLGISFVPEGTSFCLTPNLEPFLEEAGFCEVRSSTDLLNFSAGKPAADSLFQNTLHFLEEFRGVVLKMGAMPETEYEALHDQAVHDMQQPNFRGLWYLLNVVGRKPE